jgi:hypothetical protein
MTDERTVTELITDAENLPVGQASAALAALRQDASADGITVTVDLHGKLVGLDVSRTALERGAADLASRISDLVAEAAAVAARQGLAVLATLPGVAESPLLDEIQHRLPTPPANDAPVPTPPAPDPEPEDSPVPVLHEAW